MVQQDGSILQVIPDYNGPWTTGDVEQPNAKAIKLLNAFGWDPNVWSIALELEGYASGGHTTEQIESTVWLIHSLQRLYPKTRGTDRLPSHSDFTWYKSDPGWVGDVIRQLVWKGNNVYPNGMDKGIAEWLFGSAKDPNGKVFKFDEKGTISRQWLSLIAKYGPSPLMKVWKVGDGREYFQFSNYTIWRPNAQSTWRILN
jgi:hypothetical protein